MSSINILLMRVKYALESLDEDKQYEVVKYVEFHAGKGELSNDLTLDLFLNEGKEDDKKIN